MKQHTKWFATVSAIAISFVITSSTQAQTYNFSTGSTSSMGTDGNWNSSMYSITGSGLEVNYTTSTPGFTYGGGYYNFGAFSVNMNSIQVTLTLTVTGSLSDYNWNFSGFNLNDSAVGNDAGYPYPNASPYSGPGNPGNPAGFTWVTNSPTSYTLTETADLSPAFLTSVQGGSAAVYGINLNFNPTSAAGGYIVTFNSLAFSPAPVPEPTTLVLAGLGVASLLVFRRRK